MDQAQFDYYSESFRKNDLDWYRLASEAHDQ